MGKAADGACEDKIKTINLATESIENLKKRNLRLKGAPWRDCIETESLALRPPPFIATKVKKIQVCYPVPEGPWCEPLALPVPRIPLSTRALQAAVLALKFAILYGAYKGMDILGIWGNSNQTARLSCEARVAAGLLPTCPQKPDVYDMATAWYSLKLVWNQGITKIFQCLVTGPTEKISGPQEICLTALEEKEKNKPLRVLPNV